MADGVVQYIVRLTDKTKAGTRSAVQGSERLEKQTKDTTRAVDRLGDESAQTGRQLDRMGKEGKQAGAGVAGLSRGMSGALSSVSGLSAGVGGLVATLGIGALVGTLTAATRAVFQFGQEVADLRNDISDASTRSGIAADTLQGLRLAAEGSGLSFSSLTSGLDQFGRRLSDAAKGGNATAEAFEKLKVEVTDGEGGLRSADEVLGELLGKLNQMPNDGERSALAVETLGRSGGKLLQALSGSELEDFVALAQEFGIDVGPKAATAAGRWQRASAELGTVLDGLKGEMVDVIGGADALISFTESVIIAFHGLGGMIDGFAEGFESAFDRILKPFDALIAGIEQLLTGLEKLGRGDFTGGIESLRGSLDSLTDAAMATPAAAGSALTGGLLEAGLTAGFRGAEAADVEGGAAVARLQELRAAIESSQTIVTPDRKDDPEKIGKEIGEATAEEIDLQLSRMFGNEALATSNAAIRQVTKFGSGDFDAILKASADNLADQFDASAAMAQATRAGRLETAQTAIGVTGQVLGGDLGGGLSSIAGATGMAGLGVAGAAISGLQFIGEQGADGIRDTLDGVKDGLIAALEALPELIGKVLPDFAVSLVSELIPALIEAAPQLFEALLVELPIAIAVAIGEILRSAVTDEENRGRNIGAVIGGVGGFLLGGPVGAAVGAGVGGALGGQAQDIVESRRSGGGPVGDGPSLSGRTASAGQMSTARESDRLAAMSTRSRGRPRSVQGNPFDALAAQFDSQFGTYGRATSTTIGVPA